MVIFIVLDLTRTHLISIKNKVSRAVKLNQLYLNSLKTIFVALDGKNTHLISMPNQITFCCEVESDISKFDIGCLHSSRSYEETFKEMPKN